MESEGGISLVKNGLLLPGGVLTGTAGGEMRVDHFLQHPDAPAETIRSASFDIPHHGNVHSLHVSHGPEGWSGALHLVNNALGHERVALGEDDRASRRVGSLEEMFATIPDHLASAPPADPGRSHIVDSLMADNDRVSHGGRYLHGLLTYEDRHDPQYLQRSYDLDSRQESEYRGPRRFGA